MIAQNGISAQLMPDKKPGVGMLLDTSAGKAVHEKNSNYLSSCRMLQLLLT